MTSDAGAGSGNAVEILRRGDALASHQRRMLHQVLAAAASHDGDPVELLTNRVLAWYGSEALDAAIAAAEGVLAPGDPDDVRSALLALADRFSPTGRYGSALALDMDVSIAARWPADLAKRAGDDRVGAVDGDANAAARRFAQPHRRGFGGSV